MLGSIASILNSSLEISLVIVIILMGLYKSNLKALKRALWLGIFGAVASALLIVYRVDFFGDREIFEGYLSFGASLLAIIYLAWIWYGLRKNEIITKNENKGLILKSLFILIVVWFLTLSKTIEVVLYPSTVFIMNTNFLNTEIILKLIGAILGLILAIFFGLTLLKTELRISRKAYLIFSTAVLAVMVFRQLIMVLQILFAIGFLPLTPWAIAIIAPLINSYYPMFFYLLIGLTLILWGQIKHQLKKTPPDLSSANNPALRRKIMAGFNRQKRWISAVGISLAVVVILLGGNAALANRNAKIEPPTPITAEDGKIRIPLEKINDGKLYRFSYLTSNNVETRFLVIKKGERLYGVGFDACDICGNAGYYQRGKAVICKNCDVEISIPTIGFPGGCNPIPMKSKIDGQALIINPGDLEAKEDIFNE